MDTPRIPARVFGEVAEDFDRVRLGYPAALVDDVLAFAGAGLDGRRALEVGAGTGKATVAFADRGVPIVALEPDPAMAAILARHLPGTDIVTCAFEDYVAPEPFGLLFCADAWHWTHPASRWRSVAQALAPGGTLALIWNYERIQDPVWRAAMRSIVAEQVPSMTIIDEPPDEAHLLHAWPGDEIAGRSELVELTTRIYRWVHTSSGADYVTHVSTRSQCRMLEPAVRQRLLAALTELFVDEVTLDVNTVCFLAHT
jgi:SAM-dependent methyltransferase